MVNHHSAVRRDQFGGAVLRAGAGGSAAPGGGGTPVKIDEFKGFLYSLATAETTGKATLDELVKANSTLTLSITELTAMNNRLT